MDYGTRMCIVVVTSIVAFVLMVVWIIYGLVCLFEMPSPTTWHTFILYISQVLAPLLAAIYLAKGLVDYEHTKDS